MATNAASPGVLQKRPSKVDEAILNDLVQLGEVQCSLDEVAGFLGLTSAGLRRLFKTAKVRRAYEQGRARGVVALRQAQFKMAATSVPMAMLLGKAYLGHDERRETDESALIDQTGAGERVRAKVAALAAEESPNRGRQGD